jgi:glyoxylase-like metal-dependent hydrolase (beta-lactamase superfamily II)
MQPDVRLGATVRRLVAPNPGPMTGPGTNTYLIGGRDVTVLDPGPDDPRHAAAILRATAGAISCIVVTHTHRDHSPLAARLARETGAAVIGLAAPQDGRQDDSFVPTREPADGERLQLGGCELLALHTPGHASNCVCYLLSAERLLFTGDHVLQGVSPVILPPDGDMQQYLASLDKLAAYDFDRIAPGHGDVVMEPKAALRALTAHRLAREAKVLRALQRAGATSPEALTALVYDDVGTDLHAWAQCTLLAHLIKLERDGRVALRNGHWRAIAA